MRKEEVQMESNSWIENALECVCSALAIALVAVAAWLFCAATPSQSSAEADMERGGAAASQDLHGGAAMLSGGSHMAEAGR